MILAALQLDLLPDEIQRIVSFLGYGRISAPVWFIGIEEGLGGVSLEEAVKNLKARGSFELTMDLYEACLNLQEAGQPIDIVTHTPSTQVWRFMAKIMRAYMGEQNWRDPKAAKEYVQSRLGRHDGDTFLTELSPIPAGNTADTTWMTWFHERDPELHQKLQQRRETLREMLRERENDPPLIICYSLPRADEFAEFLGIEWQPVSARVRSSPDCKNWILPFFGNGQMSHSVIQELLGRWN